MEKYQSKTTPNMTFNQQEDLLIIPDVHGRKFWRNALEEKKHKHVIFLGDYVDPYPQEEIYPSDAYQELVDIIHFARDNRNTTTLLLGNHDMHYKSELFRQLAEGTRHSYMWNDKLKAIFNENNDLFQLAYEAEYEDTHCLFTHAGVSSVWYEGVKEKVGELNADNLNKLLKDDDGIRAISDVGYMRGGFAKAGGILWADLDEVNGATPIKEGYQIFGHTQHRNGPTINKNIACLDCRRAFLLSEVMQLRDKED